MRKKAGLITLVALGCMVFTSATFACHSNYFNEMFTKMKSQNLTKDQLASMFELKKNFDNQKSLDHKHGHNCSHHDSHVPDFIGAAAGVLTDKQFEAATGQKKTEAQKLRFEVNQLKNEIKQIKRMIRELKESLEK